MLYQYIFLIEEYRIENVIKFIYNKRCYVQFSQTFCIKN